VGGGIKGSVSGDVPQGKKRILKGERTKRKTLNVQRPTGNAGFQKWRNKKMMSRH